MGYPCICTQLIRARRLCQDSRPPKDPLFSSWHGRGKIPLCLEIRLARTAGIRAGVCCRFPASFASDLEKSLIIETTRRNGIRDTQARGSKTRIAVGIRQPPPHRRPERTKTRVRSSIHPGH